MSKTRTSPFLFQKIMIFIFFKWAGEPSGCDRVGKGTGDGLTENRGVATLLKWGMKCFRPRAPAPDTFPRCSFLPGRANSNEAGRSRKDGVSFVHCPGPTDPWVLKLMPLPGEGG